MVAGEIFGSEVKENRNNNFNLATVKIYTKISQSKKVIEELIAWGHFCCKLCRSLNIPRDTFFGV